jgi:thiamine-phosphate pyrophosphorylase
MTWRLMLVTDRRRLAPEARTTRDELLALEALLDEAVSAGVDVIQLREPDLDARTLLGCADGVARRVTGTNVRLVVNDRADVAIAAGAHGVHLPGRGLQARRVRTLAPGVLGRSIHSGEAADDADLDYLLFGTVFASASKPAAAPAGIDALRHAVRRTALPVLAIGGITPQTVGACLEAGARGVAAIAPFLPPGRAPQAMGVGPAVRAFREALSRIC